jgi:hypothetical protein
MKLKQFLQKYNLTFLPVATPDVVPGAVLTKRKGYMYWGHLDQILQGEPKRFWSVEMEPANIIEGTVERTLSLKGKSSLGQMGVQVDGGLKRAKSVKFSISAVRVRTFRNGRGYASMLSLIPKIQRLKKRNRAAWKTINNKRVVLEVYYASEATVSFATSGEVNLKAEIAKAGGVTVEGDGVVKWTGKKSFKIARNDKVPFAFRGWII